MTKTRINSSGEVVTMVGTDEEIHAMMRPCPECNEVDCICPDPIEDDDDKSNKSEPIKDTFVGICPRCFQNAYCDNCGGSR